MIYHEKFNKASLVMGESATTRETAIVLMIEWLAKRGVEVRLTPVGKGYTLEWGICRYAKDEDAEWTFDAFLTHHGWNRDIPGSLTFTDIFDALCTAVLAQGETTDGLLQRRISL